MEPRVWRTLSFTPTALNKCRYACAAVARNPNVSVTFDDGYENAVHKALSELARRGIFLISEALGATPNWDELLMLF